MTTRTTYQEDNNNKRKEAWEKNFMALIDYKGKHGDCNVPSLQNAEKNPYKSLYKFCDKQRAKYKAGTLKEDQLQRLSAIGFTWKGVRGQEFDIRIRQLEEFKEKHGHCHVPQVDEILGEWVHHTRKAYDKKTILPERIDRLNEVGFVWRVRAQRTKRKSSSTTTTEPIVETSDATAVAAGITTNNNAYSPPVTKKPKRSIPRNKHPLSDSSYNQIQQILSDLSGAGDWGDWVSDQSDFMDTMSRTRQSDQKNCLTMLCTLQLQFQKWNDAVAACKEELLEITNLTPKV